MIGTYRSCTWKWLFACNMEMRSFYRNNISVGGSPGCHGTRRCQFAAMEVVDIGLGIVVVVVPVVGFGLDVLEMVTAF